MRSLTAVDLVANLTAGIVDQNLALSALDKDQKYGHKCHGSKNQQGEGRIHRIVSHQIQQAGHSSRQSRSNACKNDDGCTVANATLGNLLTQPH